MLAIDRVADNRRTNMRHVNTDLMGAARFKPTFHHRGGRQGRLLIQCAKCLNGFIVGDGVLTLFDIPIAIRLMPSPVVSRRMWKST